MSINTVVLCPGQGAQAVGMGKAWFDASPEAQETFRQADQVLAGRLGASLSSLCFEGPAERLNQTDVSQPAIYVTSVACWRAITAARGRLPLAATAGLSLGEYTALHISGAVSFEDGLELVTLRGRAMQDAADSPEARTGGGGGMIALIGATDEQGRYELLYTGNAKGAVMGPNLVRINSRTDAPPGPDWKDPIPARYNSRSELKADVVAGTNTFDFALESK